MLWMPGLGGFDGIFKKFDKQMKKFDKLND